MIETMGTECIIFGEALKIRGQKHKQNLPEDYSKSIKMAITVCLISKNFRGSIPPDPLKIVFVTLVA